MKKVAVVILNWNGQKLLEQFLPSVINHSNCVDTEIVVADNCSSDSSIEYLRKEYPQVRLILLSENHGYARGYNEALNQVDAEYTVLLNSDVEVTEGWLQTMLDYMEGNPSITAIQPKILSQRDKNYFEYAGASGGFIDKYGYPFCRGRIFNALEKDFGQYNTPIDVFWTSGACFMIRLKDFKDCGGFDATFFAHMEEIDLCWRLNARGKRLVCLPQSTVYHVGAATLSVESPRKTFLNFRNNLLMLYKNMTEKDFNRTYRIRIFFDYLAALHFFITGKTKNTCAILQAHKEFRKIKSDYLTVRNHNLNKAIVTQSQTVYSNSILYSFYLRGCKVFSKLKF